MNKKFLSAILLGALTLASTGSFVSCKDYDDDIKNLQSQITGNQSQIAGNTSAINDVKNLVSQLQSKLDGLTYVKSVSKSADGKTITFTMSNGQTVDFVDHDTVVEPGSVVTVVDGVLYVDGKATDIKAADPGSVVTVEDGVLCIDGKATEIKVASAINMPKVENGQLYVYDETKKEYVATGITVNQNSVVESATKYTVTMVDKDGKVVSFDVPKASGLMTEIKLVVPNATEVATFAVNQYTVANKPSDWKGPKKALAKNTLVYSFGTVGIAANPVNIDLTGSEFVLVNSKNEALPDVKLTASARENDGALGISSVPVTRADKVSGFWNLSQGNLIVANADATKLDDVASAANNGAVAYAVTNGSVFSSYYVKIVYKTTELPSVTAATLKDNSNALVGTATATNPQPAKVEVNKVYNIGAVEASALYDLYASVSDLDKETFGIVIDNEARTLKVTKKPDVITTDVHFDLTVQMLDNAGYIKTAVYRISLDSKIATDSKFEAVNYNLAQLLDLNPNNNAFVVALDPMKTALGDEYVRWANNVDLTKTETTYYTNEACNEGAVIANGTNAPEAVAAKADGKTEDVSNSNVAAVKFSIATTQSALKIGKQYYAKVTFKDASSNEINSIVIPVKFTAPTVADQFTAKAGYVVDGVINAYFHDVNYKTVDLTRYFDASDVNATLKLKSDDKLVKIGSADKHSKDLAQFAVQSGEDKLDETTLSTTAKYLVLTDIRVNSWDATEAGYGKVLTVNAENANYSSTSWSYNADADKKASFKIKVMSPIYEGSIKPAAGSSVSLVANNVDGSNITSDMVVATDYTGTNKIQIMPDQVAPSGTTDQWKNPQIVEVAVGKAANNTYVKEVAVKAYTAATETAAAKLGYINVKADAVSNDVQTSIYVFVTDAWGYTNSIELPVTITKE